MSTDGDKEKDKEDKLGKQQNNIPGTDTEELKRFREKWKRELQLPPPLPPSSTSPATPSTSSHPTSFHPSLLSSLHDPLKPSFAYTRGNLGENRLISRFLALLEEEEEKEQEERPEGGEKEGKKDSLPPPIFVLPPELQLAIFANLDVKSLEHCSIVCRFWYILARYDIEEMWE